MSQLTTTSDTAQTPVSGTEADLIDCKTACRLIGGSVKPIHASTLRRLVKCGLLPPPVQIGLRLKRWSRKACVALTTTGVVSPGATVPTIVPRKPTI